MFISTNQVRTHDIDMAGILYFPRQFRFVNEAIEDLMEKEEISFYKLFTTEPFLFVIVHAESDYLAPLYIGDRLEIHTGISHFGTTSFTMVYHIYKKGEHLSLVGKAKTVHVTLEKATRKSIPLPEEMIKIFKKYPST